MTCHDLAQRLLTLQPELSPTDVARLCLLILSQCDDSQQLADEAVLAAAWNNASFRLEAAADQHDAVADELDQICGDDGKSLEADQLWTLLRAIKVQSQILELYTQPSVVA